MARLGQFRRDTLANWTAQNPILADGEFALVASDSANPRKYNYWVCGNGTSTFSQLPMAQMASAIGITGITSELGNSESLAMSQKGVTNKIDINLSGTPFDNNDSNKYTLENALNILKKNNISIIPGNSIKFISEEGKLEIYTYGGGEINKISSWYKNLYETLKDISELPSLEEGGVFLTTATNDDNYIGTRVRSVDFLESKLIKSISCSSNIVCRVFNLDKNKKVIWNDDYSTEKNGREISNYFRLIFKKSDESKITVEDVVNNLKITYCIDNFIDKDNQLLINEKLQKEVEASIKEKIISSENSEIITYLTDKNGVILVTIDKRGSIYFNGGGFAGENNYTISNDSNIIKVLTDKNGVIIGYIDNTGKVYIDTLEVKNFKSNIIDKLTSIISFISNGVDNHKIINDKIYNLLELNKGRYEKKGITIKTVPTIILHDDDTIDRQIPVSYLSTATDDTPPSGINASEGGGYASILWAVLKSLNVRFKDTIDATNNRIVCNLAAEGQRIGLTPLYGEVDTFTGQLNFNGKYIKKLSEHEGWEVMCHSMTARYISENYLVNGLNSDFAKEILLRGIWNGNLSWGTTTCYDTITKKNYQILQDKSGWSELPLHYAKPYLAESLASNSKLIINPTYSVKYQVKTWFDRAKIAKLPHLNVSVNWGNSHSIWHMKETLKYADLAFGLHSIINKVPLDTNIHRLSYDPSPGIDGITEYTNYYNVYSENAWNKIKNAIDLCIKDNGLLVLASHANTDTWANKYWSYFNYPTQQIDDRLNYKDDNYNQEWIVPLKYEELKTIDENNYWENPPSRLGISNWGEWYPCPGTTPAMLYDAFIYAIKNGVRFASSSEAIESFGNLLNIGIKKDAATDTWAADYRLGNIPEQNIFYCIIGADGSINYKS